jgi:hypothetical protein
VIDICERLIHTWVEAANAGILVVGKTIEGGPVLLNVVVNAANVVPFEEGRIIATREKREIAELHRAL